MFHLAMLKKDIKCGLFWAEIHPPSKFGRHLFSNNTADKPPNKQRDKRTQVKT